MKIITQGRKIGRAVKNAQRLRQILSVFAKHGYNDVILRLNLGRFLPARIEAKLNESADITTQEHLRLALEELGPTFVKLGQLLSTRPDLIPESYIDELVKLQDNVQTISYEEVKEVIESEFGQSIHQTYQSFNPEPLASASIGQVHEAVLPTGEKVVVKVQRPGIQKTIEQDIDLLAFIAGLLEKYIPESRIFRPKVIVDEFFRTLNFELDFYIEANNTNRARENLKGIQDVLVPIVYKSHCTSRILTIEKFEGIKVNDLKALEAAGVDKKLVNEIGARAFFKSIMIDGFFHGDLHGGNLFVLPGNRLGIIDFGIVGHLSRKSREQLANMVMSLLTEDFENLCYQYVELGTAGPQVDFDGFQREVRNALSPYLGMTLNEMNSGKVLIEATKIATKYQIQIPGDWMLVFKSLMTVEGMGRTLDPDFDLMSMGRGLVKDLLKDQYNISNLSKDWIWIAKDLGTLLQVLPRQIRWMFKKFNNDGFAFEIISPQIENLREDLKSHSKKSSASILGAGLFIAGALSLQSTQTQDIWGYPLISLLLFGLGSVMFLKSLF